MRVVFDGPIFKLEHCDKLLSYLLTCKATNEEVLIIEGQDAINLIVELDIIECSAEGLGADKIGARLWFDCEYGLAAKPIAS